LANTSAPSVTRASLNRMQSTPATRGETRLALGLRAQNRLV
jgi:hypothetical protein